MNKLSPYICNLHCPYTMQTHTTPVLLGHRDRAELAGQEYSTLVSVMEGVVIVDKIPELAVQT